MNIPKPAIDICNLRKAYNAEVVAVRDVSLQIQRGTLVALLGPSGCGKSTTLRLIAGLETPDAGEIWLEDECVAGPRSWVPPEARRVGMVFQDYALFPHLTTYKNVAFPLNGKGKRMHQHHVQTMLDMVGMATLGERYPHQLSGGQQQRVALARALVAQPAVVLLDEPFSNLDAALRKSMRTEVREILQAAGATTIFVTHDQEEAFSIADLVVVMFDGQVMQHGRPQDIYVQPATREVASFVGETNFLPGHAQGTSVECVLGRLPLAVPTHGPVDILVRPEMLLLQPDPQGAGRVEQITFFGHDQLLQLRLDDGLHLQARTLMRLDLNPSVPVQIGVQGPVMAYPCVNRHGLHQYEASNIETRR